MEKANNSAIIPSISEPLLNAVPTPGNSWIEISARALNHNISVYRALAQAHTQLAAIVKGNAYGHGMVPIAQFLDKHPAIDWLCTASISEALTLRKAHIKKSIAVLSYHDAPLVDAIEQNIDLVAYDFESANAISQAAQQIGKSAYLHIKLDTGLSRLGIRVEENTIDQTIALLHSISALPGIKVRALFSHFADAESDDHSFVTRQQKRFAKISSCFNYPKHFSCTAALGTVDLQHYHIARFGIGLYGLWPSTENKHAIEKQGHTLLPILSWKTGIIQIKQIPAGSSVGYDRTHISERPTTIAIIPVGYADGIDRKLSNRGNVLVNGNVAPIIGRVSMNLTIIDVTDIPNVKAHDEVQLIGEHVAIHPDTLAQHIGTINYEVVTRISPLISRIIVS